MLTATTSPYRLNLREGLGLAHELQVVEVPVPAGAEGLFFLREEKTGRLHPAQASRQKPGRGFLRLALAPGESLSLVETKETENVPNGVAITRMEQGWLLENGLLSLELRAGTKVFPPEYSREPVAGPLIRLRSGAGPWRGATFFDTRLPALHERAEWRESGPLRAVYQYRLDFAEDHFYELELTADADSDFVRLAETFSGAATDQIVWDFSGDDLPETLLLLDSTAGHAAKPLDYHFDQRHARLWGWTQFSQLHDLSDGFALQFPRADDVVGFVALEGGTWRGNALNHLEAWARRWESNDPDTRRLPPEAKADSFPGPERIAARGESVCAPHFSVEGWLRRGHRAFALMLSNRRALAPTEEKPARPLGHFEDLPDRPRYRAQQGRLRKIHIQHGLMPLQDQLAMCLTWPLERDFETGAVSLPERQRALAMAPIRWDAPAAAPERELIDAYLQARVFGFWEGSGAAYSNCVAGRKIGPALLRMESLAREGKLDPATLAQWRAWFAFLACLNASENFYPGPATMEPIGAPNATEPTLAGMANQNFYTDAITVFGLAGDVLHGHPQAAFWRDRFGAQWQRQLAYHVYPESGLWEESHTYYQHVLATVLPLLLRRRASGADDPFADPMLHKLLAGALSQLTPRDAVMGGVRHLVAFGDHGADVLTYRELYPEFARAVAPHALELAQRLAWMGQEMGSEAIPGLAPLRLAWKHGRVEGLGFFFRGTDTAGRENLLALRSGTAWGHHHQDEGSIQFFAHGRAMIVDSAFGRPQERRERKIAVAGHSRAAVEGIEPLHHLWRFNRGWILEARPDGDLAYAVAGVPLHATWPKGLEARMLPLACRELRAVVELAPAVYLIADYLDSSHRHHVRFHVAHPDVEVHDGVVSCFFDGTSHLHIVPLGEVAAPACSPDRPLQEAERETTTAVDYAGVTGPWSLFVVAGLPGRESSFAVSTDRRTVQPSGQEKAVAVKVRDDHQLDISREGSSSTVQIAPEPLLAALRAGRAR